MGVGSKLVGLIHGACSSWIWLEFVSLGQNL